MATSLRDVRGVVEDATADVAPPPHATPSRVAAASASHYEREWDEAVDRLSSSFSATRLLQLQQPPGTASAALLPELMTTPAAPRSLSPVQARTAPQLQRQLRWASPSTPHPQSSFALSATAHPREEAASSRPRPRTVDAGMSRSSSEFRLREVASRARYDARAARGANSALRSRLLGEARRAAMGASQAGAAMGAARRGAAATAALRVRGEALQNELWAEIERAAKLRDENAQLKALGLDLLSTGDEGDVRFENPLQPELDEARRTTRELQREEERARRELECERALTACCAAVATSLAREEAEAEMAGYKRAALAAEAEAASLRGKVSRLEELEAQREAMAQKLAAAGALEGRLEEVEGVLKSTRGQLVTAEEAMRTAEAAGAAEAAGRRAEAERAERGAVRCAELEAYLDARAAALGASEAETARWRAAAEREAMAKEGALSEAERLQQRFRRTLELQFKDVWVTEVEVQARLAAAAEAAAAAHEAGMVPVRESLLRSNRRTAQLQVQVVSLQRSGAFAVGRIRALEEERDGVQFKLDKLRSRDAKGAAKAAAHAALWAAAVAMKAAEHVEIVVEVAAKDGQERQRLQEEADRAQAALEGRVYVAPPKKGADSGGGGGGGGLLKMLGKPAAAAKAADVPDASDQAGPETTLVGDATPKAAAAAEAATSASAEKQAAVEGKPAAAAAVAAVVRPARSFATTRAAAKENELGGREEEEDEADRVAAGNEDVAAAAAEETAPSEPAELSAAAPSAAATATSAAPTVAAGAPQPSTDGDWQRRREELCAFYEQHEPSKVAAVDSLLENSFEELCDALVEKYGQALLPFSEMKGKAWVSTYDPSPRPSELDAGGNEAVRQLRREELVAFYREHDPSKIPVVDKLLANAFDELCDALFEKYGRTPFSEIEAQA